jgi:tripartite-type tricarboxylate transporter receptor subunit TctC
MGVHFVARSFGVTAAAAILTHAAGATAASDFYRGKTISIIVGSAPGGAYDAYARLIARHYGEHIPGSPGVIVRNLPGAASMMATEHFYNESPKDGTELGAILNTVPLTELMNPKAYPFHAKNLNWLGTVASPANVLAVWYTSGVANIDDAKRKQILIGSTTRLTTKDIFPRIADGLLKTKFKVVNGYGGTAEIDTALERGEIQGDGSNSWVSYRVQKAEWVKDKKIIPLFQVTFARDRDLQTVPTLMELAQGDEQKQLMRIITTTGEIGTPLVAPPGVSSDRIDILRRSFDEMTRDQVFLSDANKAQLEVSPMAGGALQDMVAEMMGTPSAVVDEFRALVNAP